MSLHDKALNGSVRQKLSTAWRTKPGLWAEGTVSSLFCCLTAQALSRRWASCLFRCSTLSSPRKGYTWCRKEFVSIYDHKGSRYILSPLAFLKVLVINFGSKVTCLWYAKTVLKQLFYMFNTHTFLHTCLLVYPYILIDSSVRTFFTMNPFNAKDSICIKWIDLIMKDDIQNVSQNTWQETPIFQSYTQRILKVLSQYWLIQNWL